MNFDPISYAIQRMDQLQMRVKDLEINHQTNRETIGQLDKRIGSIELWQKSLTRMLRRWPLVVAPMGIIGLNAVGPEATVKAIINLLKVVL